MEFYLVYVEGSSTPTTKHRDEIDALKEAKRLSEKEMKDTFVLKPFKKIHTEIKQEVCILQ